MSLLADVIVPPRFPSEDSVISLWLNYNFLFLSQMKRNIISFDLHSSKGEHAVANGYHAFTKYLASIEANITALFFLLSFSTPSLAQDLMGTVLDENGGPMEYATVSLRTLPDSSVVMGAVTDSQGSFNIQYSGAGDYVQISMIGYLTENRATAAFAERQIIHMRPDTHMLQEAVVSAVLPKTEFKDGAVVTNIAGSVLEHSGNALDVLAKVPGMISRNGSLEVIGRGEPQYWINGRRVTDNSELRNLMSEDIKSIDVVSNPGSAYGGEVRCLVRIRTVKHQGDGFGFALSSQTKKHIYNNHEAEPSWSVLDLNYRKGGVDFFGKLVFWNQQNYQVGNVNAVSYIWKDSHVLTGSQEGMLNYRANNGGWQYTLGSNWQINDKHSLGFKFETGINTIGDDKLIIYGDVKMDDVLSDQVHSVKDGSFPLNKSYNGNLYYDGNIDKLNINFNFDFVGGLQNSRSDISETSWVGLTSIDQHSESFTAMSAGKLMLTYPVWKGSLQFGSEETYVTAAQSNYISKQEIPATKGSIAENNIAGWVEYGVLLPIGQLSAGVRFEHVNYGYVDDYHPENNLIRVQNNWFPSFSFSTKAGPVGLSLSYTGKTLRPRFDQLTNEIIYDNRFTYQTGDPKLENEIQRTLSLNAGWKWLVFSGNYETVLNSFYQYAYPYNDEAVIMIKYSNMKDPLRKLNLYLSASPTVGVWNPRYTIGMEKQFFTTTVVDPRTISGTRTDTYDRPMYLVQAYNSFRFKHSWMIDLDYQLISPFDQLITRIERPLQNLNLSVSKSFLKDEALSVKLSWNDILNKSVPFFTIDYGSCVIQEHQDGYSPCILLRVSYRFNTATSKYKGTGAGEGTKSRL